MTMSSHQQQLDTFYRFPTYRSGSTLPYFRFRRPRPRLRGSGRCPPTTDTWPRERERERRGRDCANGEGYHHQRRVTAELANGDKGKRDTSLTTVRTFGPVVPPLVHTLVAQVRRLLPSLRKVVHVYGEARASYGAPERATISESTPIR